MINISLINVLDAHVKSDPEILMEVLGIILIIIVASIVGKWKLFEKAGYSGVSSIIPIYSDYIYVKASGVFIGYFFLVIAFNYFLIAEMLFGNYSINGYVFLISLLCWKIGLFFCNYNISRKIHKGMGYTLLLTFFSVIMLPIIGLSGIKWDDDVMVSLHGPFGEKRKTGNNLNNNTKESGYRYCSSCGSRVETDAKFCKKCGKEI